MSLITKRTIYGNALMTAQFKNVKHVVQPNSTLNEKFGVLEATHADENPALGYYCIGNGGHHYDTAEGNMALPTTRYHRARDAALFKHLPFVMRELDNDLDAVTRAKYAGRTIENFGGVDYYCYWLKRVPASSDPVEVSHNVTNLDGIDTNPFIPGPEDLNPLPIEIPPEGVVPGTGETLSVSSDVVIDFDSIDAENLREVCRIRFDNENFAIVSEIGLCSGEDKDYTFTPAAGNPYSLLEAVDVQIAIHVSCLYPMAYSNEGFKLGIDIGASEPLAVEVI